MMILMIIPVIIPVVISIPVICIPGNMIILMIVPVMDSLRGSSAKIGTMQRR